MEGRKISGRKKNDFPIVAILSWAMSEIAAKIVLPLKNLKANIFNRCMFASFQYWRMTVNPEHSDFDINAPEILGAESAPEIFG